MKQYKQLTSEVRYQVYGLKQAGLNQTRIAQKIGVDKSTISREFRRNKGQRGWRPKQAQSLCDERRQSRVVESCCSIELQISHENGLVQLEQQANPRATLGATGQARMSCFKHSCGLTLCIR